MKKAFGDEYQKLGLLGQHCPTQLRFLVSVFNLINRMCHIIQMQNT